MANVSGIDQTGPLYTIKKHTGKWVSLHGVNRFTRVDWARGDTERYNDTEKAMVVSVRGRDEPVKARTSYRED